MRRSGTRSLPSTRRTRSPRSFVAATGSATAWSGRRSSRWRVHRSPRRPTTTPSHRSLAVKRDYYEVLGCARQASAEDLKRAFRKIAMDSHPDRNPDDPAVAARFREASEAYAVLSDPGRRRSYDMFGHAVESGGGPAVDFSDMPFADIFDTFFGGGFGGRARRERSNRGDDLRYDLTITFEEAFTGVEKQIDVARLLTCDRCSGSGAEPGTGDEESGHRGGQPGDLYVVLRVKAHPHLARHEQDTVYELRVNMVQAALGDRIEIPTLEGTVEIAIPAGTQHGQSFRLAGRGMPDVRGGRRGDQYVVVQVVVPKDLTPEQKVLLRKVGGLTGKPEKVSKGFFEKLRDAISLD